MTKRYCFTVILLFTLLFTRAQINEATVEYIKTYCGIAVEEMQRTGVPASIKLAQGILESMSGQSPLVLKSNNHFGIKCKEGYNGPYVLHDDDRPKERFMKYETAEESYRAHSDFLKNRSRYASLFQLDPTDYKGWAYGLKKAGYATNPKYPQLLISLIERYNLHEYTLMGLGQLAMNEDVSNYFATKNGTSPSTIATAAKEAEVSYPQEPFTINNTKVVFVKAGTSLQSIADKYNIPLERLYDLNDFDEITSVSSKDRLVYLQLKRTISEKAYHEVKAGETLYDIAQQEGIRLESLLKYNRLSKFDKPAVGSKLKLQDNADIAIN